MRLTFSCCALSGKAAKKFIKYSQYSPTPLSINKLLKFGQNPVQSKSFEFLSHELPVRLANIMQEIHLLPENLLKTPSVKSVIGLYEQSFMDLMGINEKTEPSDSVLNDFTDALDKIVTRHSSVVQMMAEGVIEMRGIYGFDHQTDNHIQYFLDRFYMSRISIRMLINQHVLVFGPVLKESRKQIGCIDPNCDVLAVLNDAYANARFLCEQFYLCSPEMQLETVGFAGLSEFSYVPSHLYHILFELFKNAMRAEVELDEDHITPLQVLVVIGNNDLTIRISDRGGGIKQSDINLVFKYTYTTASPAASQSNAQSAPLAGYGYGLPLSRLYAKYFNGDLQLCSVEGYGTDAYVYLKRYSAEADEVLPVFNQTSAKQYAASVPIADWTSPSSPVGNSYASKGPLPARF